MRIFSSSVSPFFARLVLYTLVYRCLNKSDPDKSSRVARSSCCMMNQSKIMNLVHEMAKLRRKINGEIRELKKENAELKQAQAEMRLEAEEAKRRKAEF